MDFKKLTQRAKKMVDDRGGPDALKQDLNELKDIAKGQGSVTDKAKKAAAALKDAGAHGHQDEDATTATTETAAGGHADPVTGAPPRPAEPGVHPFGPDEPSAPDAGLQPDPEAPGGPEPRNPA